MSVRIEALSHVYLRGTPGERVALRDVSLDIAPGGCLGIAGRSGSGKTTLVQHLNGLLQPTGGRIAINGVDVARWDLKELRRLVGIVFQYPEQQLFEETVRREVAFGLNGTGLSSDETDRRVREALHLVGLGEDLLERSPFALSGGEKRRVALAGVLVMRPEIVVLDEPAAGLDPRGCRLVLDIIANLRRERGTTVIIVSHATDHLARMADRLVVLAEGTVALEGTPRELFRDEAVIEKAGIPLPQITRLMKRLKLELPELRDDVLTVEEARAELNRILKKKPWWNGHYDERFVPGEVFPRHFTAA